MGFSAVLLPQLEDEGIDSKSDEASWIGEFIEIAWDSNIV